MTRVGIGTAAVALTMVTGGILYAQDARPQGGARPSDEQRAGSAEPGRMDAHQFVNQMAIAGMAEVQLGKLASERAASNDVKAFGQRMVKDHTQANNELKQVASRMNMQLPTQLDEEHRELEARLSKLQGAEFDRAYMDAMVKGHQEVVTKLRTRASNQMTSGDRPGGQSQSTATAGAEETGRRPATGESVGTAGGGQAEQALTQWANKTLPVVQQHLERARELQQQVSR